MGSTGFKQSPIYGNCKVLSPSGILLFRCLRERADWYTSRDLAEIVCEEPYYTVRLTFEPKGLGHDGDPYYLVDKENKCVVCGATDKLTKHHCIPYVFRKHFPDSKKNYRCHDILAICLGCHRKYEPLAIQLKKQIAREHNIALHPAFIWDYKKHRAAKWANALRRYGAQMPRTRIQEIKEYLCQYFGIGEVTEKLLDEAIGANPLHREDGAVEYGRYVVEHTPDLDELVRRWRQHFVSVMQPQFLPEFWSVNHIPKDRP